MKHPPKDNKGPMPSKTKVRIDQTIPTSPAEVIAGFNRLGSNLSDVINGYRSTDPLPWSDVAALAAAKLPIIRSAFYQLDASRRGKWNSLIYDDAFMIGTLMLQLKFDSTNRRWSSMTPRDRNAVWGLYKGRLWPLLYRLEAIESSKIESWPWEIARERITVDNSFLYEGNGNPDASLTNMLGAFEAHFPERPLSQYYGKGISVKYPVAQQESTSTRP